MATGKIFLRVTRYVSRFILWAGAGLTAARHKCGDRKSEVLVLNLSCNPGGLNGSTQHRPEVQPGGVSVAKFVRER